MTITITKEQIKKGLLILGCAIGIISLFFFFGNAVSVEGQGYKITNFASMFDCMFGKYNSSTDFELRASAGSITLFVFQLFILILSITILVLFFTKKVSKKVVLILSLSTCVLIFVCIILSFCTRTFYINSMIDKYVDYLHEFEPTAVINRRELYNQLSEGVKLGAGPITYSIFNIIGLASLASGSYFYFKEQ